MAEKRKEKIAGTTIVDQLIDIIVYRKTANYQPMKEVCMPVYEYTCKDCGKEFTVFLTIKEFEANPKIKCPHCGSDHVEKKLSAFMTKTSKKS